MEFNYGRQECLVPLVIHRMQYSYLGTASLLNMLSSLTENEQIYLLAKATLSSTSGDRHMPRSVKTLSTAISTEDGHQDPLNDRFRPLCLQVRTKTTLLQKNSQSIGTDKFKKLIKCTTKSTMKYQNPKDFRDQKVALSCKTSQCWQSVYGTLSIRMLKNYFCCNYCCMQITTD